MEEEGHDGLKMHGTEEEGERQIAAPNVSLGLVVELVAEVVTEVAAGVVIKGSPETQQQKWKYPYFTRNDIEKLSQADNQTFARRFNQNDNEFLNASTTSSWSFETIIIIESCVQESISFCIATSNWALSELQK